MGKERTFQHLISVLTSMLLIDKSKSWSCPRLDRAEACLPCRLPGSKHEQLSIHDTMVMPLACYQSLKILLHNLHCTTCVRVSSDS